VSQLNLKDLQIFALSYRGHGDSDTPTTGYTLDGFAKDLLAVAKTVGAERFVLVGFSMSGKFVQYIAAVHADRVLGLVLVAPVPARETGMQGTLTGLPPCGLSGIIDEMYSKPAWEWELIPRVGVRRRKQNIKPLVFGPAALRLREYNSSAAENPPFAASLPAGSN
jgi:pimeloyl-ACP methyl ester carboxylesterase